MTAQNPPDHFPGATKMIAALEDDVKPIRVALSDYSQWAGRPTVLEKAIAHIEAQAVRLEAAERLAADRLEQMNADRKQALVWRDQAELYEQVRKFSPREFQALWTKNVTSGAMFDDLVRAAIASEAGK